jgi:uncharacterized protein YndB with AHSA1/START domain
MQTAIKHHWFYNCPPQEVWDYLTNPELLSAWLMNNDIKPVVGHRFMFKINPIPAMDFDGKVYCEVLESIPDKKLVYTWKAGPGDGSLNLDTVVTWTITPRDGGTELFLEHRGFEPDINKIMFQAMDNGWKKNISELLANLILRNHADETAGKQSH